MTVHGQACTWTIGAWSIAFAASVAVGASVLGHLPAAVTVARITARRELH